jgi:hypothetical protein
VVADGRVQEVDPAFTLLQNTDSRFCQQVAALGEAEDVRLRQIAKDKFDNKPYVAPLINPADFEDDPGSRSEPRYPSNMAALPTFHSSRLVGVLSQLPTNRFSTNRI